ncbi:TrmH family RNA methyltransferase [Acholeplasma granularum]|uniref:TrmH family RNA methyltransferase n=1 Tax=Acholeplasma granularum TaxID=264635 RepID=UPI0004B3F3A7|nr:RNA methyltransferase [Acholeplasma granularum]
MIESKDNKKFKEWMKLKLKKHRDLTNQFLVFGNTLVDLALKNDLVIEIVTSNPEIDGTQIHPKLMKELNLTQTPYDVMAICRKKQNPISSQNILVLDDIQNPDNLGALLRSALAFGFRHVVLSEKSADLYNDKTIRASSGALFELFVERKNIVDFILRKKEDNYQAFGADAHESNLKPIKGNPYILVLGNEGHGLSNEVSHILDGKIKIETQNVESLNVAVAGSILMYEWSRR